MHARAAGDLFEFWRSEQEKWREKNRQFSEMRAKTRSEKLGYYKFLRKKYEPCNMSTLRAIVFDFWLTFCGRTDGRTDPFF